MYFNLNQILCILLIIILCIIVYFKFLKEPFNFTNINSETTHAGTTVAGTTVAGTTVAGQETTPVGTTVAGQETTHAGTTVAGQETTQAGTTVAGQETTQAGTTVAGTTVAGQETTQAGTTNAGSTTSSNSLNNHIKNRIGLYLNVNDEGKLQIQLLHSNGTLFESPPQLKFKSFVELRNWWNSPDDDTVKFYYQPDNQQSNYGFGYKKLYKEDTKQLEEFEKQYDYLINHHGHYHNHTTQTGISINNGTQVIWSKKGKYWPHIHASDGFDPWYKPFEAQNSTVPTQNNAHH